MGHSFVQGRTYVSFGSSLREERENRGVQLISIAEATKVSVPHLHALEADDVAALPGGVFNRGIVQNYCRFLGLEEAPWLDRYAADFGQREQDWTEFAEAVKRGRTSASHGHGRRWLGVLLMLIALGALGWAAWTYVVRPRLHPAGSRVESRPAIANASARIDSL